MDALARRRLLAAMAAASATALSGCAGDGDDDTATKTATDTATSTVAETATATEEPTTGQTTTDGPVDVEQLRARARELTRRLGAGEYEAVSNAFTDEAAEVLPPERLRSAWESQTADKGAFQAVASTEHTVRNDRDVIAARATFEAGVLTVEWIFDAEGVPIGLYLRPAQGSYSSPGYVDPDAFEETTLTLPSPACDLGATLSMPTGDGPVPGVVLVHGTGPNDRDMTVGPNRVFQDIAHGLSSRGIAVLRYDKRTYACNTSRTDPVTLDDVTVDDAVTALDRLREEDRVNSAVVVGHSQGGLAAPRIAARADADAMAILAGPSGPLWQLVPMQVRYLVELDGEVTDAEAGQIEQVEAAAQRITEGDVADDEVVLGASGRYWNSFREYDQTAVAADLDVPALVQQGGRDWQVPPESVADWRAAIGDRGTYREYPDLDHLFFPGSGPSTPAQYQEPSNVDRAVVEDLASWLDGV